MDDHAHHYEDGTAMLFEDGSRMLLECDTVPRPPDGNGWTEEPCAVSQWVEVPRP